MFGQQQPETLGDVETSDAGTSPSVTQAKFQVGVSKGCASVFGGSGSASDGTPAGNVFGFTAQSGSSFFGQSDRVMAFSTAVPSTSTNANPPSRKRMKNPASILQFESITATLACASKGASFKELRMEDYQRNCKPRAGAFGQQQHSMRSMLNARHGDELLRKSLFGEELFNTQFHLFSAKSSTSGRVMKPRVLCANNAVLAKSLKYFLSVFFTARRGMQCIDWNPVLSSDKNPSDPSLIDFTDDNDVLSNAWMDDYDYESDPDLDDSDEPVHVPPKDRSAVSSSSYSDGDNYKLSNDGSESSYTSDSDMFFVGLPAETTGEDKPFDMNRDSSRSVNSKTAIQDTSNETSRNQVVVRLQSLGSRHILVRDTAFQTFRWYALLNYLYINKINFFPLTSATPGCQPPHESSTSFLDEPRCSAKSMYRLASKVGLDHLRDKALAHIRRQLTEYNILKELLCSLVISATTQDGTQCIMRPPRIPLIAANFPALARRIANEEIPHGANIIIGIHARLSKPVARDIRASDLFDESQ
ncbi:hypothetical protein OG21DRAFT_1490678 [Imleria badia]|nr:hypothetical protein OG21DRAFT_1490678 [Imleria badia]